ncbi:MAG TPA: dihydrodipicolinate reductase C-terminal domain-containing protein [Terriglobia bacterium]|nr:dihydrodipicolinate reductase C-terminal domain-containing protein [Terriglobia bacterium]
MSNASSESLDARPISLALLGYGKMGKTIAALASQRGFEVRLVMDVDVNAQGKGITVENFQGIDVCIEFTTPDAVVENIRRVAALRVNLVVGTTGWHNRLEEVRKIVEGAGVGMVYAANFSIGVNLFYRLARAAAEIFSPFAMYDPYLTEAHHKFKKDAPSGTALEIKRQIQSEFRTHEIPVTSVRAGYFPGAHELGFDSEADTIILRHTARGRQGFAEGALYAARWVVGRKGLFRFGDVLFPEGEQHE